MPRRSRMTVRSQLGGEESVCPGQTIARVGMSGQAAKRPWAPRRVYRIGAARAPGPAWRDRAGHRDRRPRSSLVSLESRGLPTRVSEHLLGRSRPAAAPCRRQGRSGARRSAPRPAARRTRRTTGATTTTSLRSPIASITTSAYRSQPGRVVLDREVRCDRVVAAVAQLGLDQVPVPADVSRAMDEREGGHEWPAPFLIVRRARSTTGASSIWPSSADGADAAR